MARAVIKKNKPMVKNGARGVRSVELGAGLLKIFSEQRRPMMLKELAELSGLSSAQVHAYLASYITLGFVERNSTNGLYHLGPACIELGIARMRSADPITLAREAARTLSQHTSLSVALVVWGSFGPTVTEVIEGVNQLNMNTKPGTVYSLSGTASGRLFAAFVSPKTFEEAANAENKEPKPNARIGNKKRLLKRDLEQIRMNLFSTIDEPPVPGINAIAAPVFDYAGQIILAITLIGPEKIFRKQSSEYVKALKEVSQRVSRDLGYFV